MSFPIRQIPTPPLSNPLSAPYPKEDSRVQNLALQNIFTGKSEKKRHYLDFLLSKHSPSQKFSDLRMLTNFMQEQGLDQKFVAFFEECTEDLLQVLPKYSRIFFFKNFVYFCRREGAISPSELKEFCQRVQTHLKTRHPRKINRMLFCFLEKKKECWPHLDEALHIARSQTKNFEVVMSMCDLFLMLPIEQWAEFAHFYIKHAEEIPVKSYGILNFFKIFNKNQRDLLLTGTTPALRYFIFKNAYDAEERAGIEILLSYSSEEIERFYLLMQRLSEHVYPSIFLFPTVFALKGLRKSLFFIDELEGGLLSICLDLENLLFTLEYGIHLHTLELPQAPNSLYLPFLDFSFGKETALINFLYENFLFFLNPVVKRIIHGDVLYLLDTIGNTLTAKTGAECQFVSHQITTIRQFVESLPTRPSPLLENTPFSNYLERTGFFIDLHSASIVVKKCDSFDNPEFLLRMLIETQLIFFNDFAVYFVEKEPQNIRGVMTYPIPSTIDDGGPKREFFYLLLKSLFASKNTPRIKKDAEGYLILSKDHTCREAIVLRDFGLLLSRLQKMEIPTGYLLPPKSFALLQFFKKNPKMPKEPFFKNVDKILNGSRLLNQQSWSLEDLEQIQKLLDLDSSQEVSEKVMDILYTSYEDQARALWEIFHSFSKEQSFAFQSDSSETVRLFFEGQGIQSEMIDQFVNFRSSHSPEITDAFKKNAQNWFLNAQQGQIDALTRLITGASNLSLGQKITLNFCKKEENMGINPMIQSFVHSCNRSIDIFMDEPEELANLFEEICKDQGFNAV